MVCENLCKRRADGGYHRKGHCFCITDEGLMDDFARGQIKVETQVVTPQPEQRIEFR